MNDKRGYRSGLVDLRAGEISREIFVNEHIYAEEQENLIKMRDYDMHHVWLKPVYMGGGMDYVVRNKKTG